MKQQQYQTYANWVTLDCIILYYLALPIYNFLFTTSFQLFFC